MKQSKFTETQIVNILKEAESGVALDELGRKHGFSKSAFYKLDFIQLKENKIQGKLRQLSTKRGVYDYPAWQI